MAVNLVRGGFAVNGFDLAPAGLDMLKTAGGTPVSGPGEAAESVPVLILMVATPAQVESVLFGEGAASRLRPGATVVLHSTVAAGFAAYLGAAILGGPYAWIGGVLCVCAIFLPGWLLIAGAMPFWHQLRAKAWMQAALRGANAAVVGVLLSALYTPVITQGIRDARDVAAAMIAFGLLEAWKVPTWAVVVASAAAGEWVLR